jgi:2-oxoglutarate dehydrogenase E1 component
MAVQVRRPTVVGYYAKHYERLKALIEGAFNRLKGEQTISK